MTEKAKVTIELTKKLANELMDNDGLLEIVRRTNVNGTT